MGGITTTDLVKNVAGVEVHGKHLRIVFSYKGVRCRESLGILPTKPNVKFASGLRASVVHEIKTKSFDYRSRFPDSQNAAKFGLTTTLKDLSLEKLINKYFSIKSVDIGPQTLRRYKVAAAQCAAYLGNDCIISSLIPEDIATMRAELVATRTPSTANNYLALFKGLLVFAYENGYTKLDLQNGCKQFKVGKTEPQPFTLEEYNRIITTGCKHDAHRNLVTVAVYTGLRTGELRALAWEDIDFQKKTMLVRRNISKDENGLFFKTTKTGETRTIQLMPPALQALKNQRQYTAMFPEVTIHVRIDRKKVDVQAVRPVFRPTTVIPNKNHIAKNSVWYAEKSLSTQWVTFLKRAAVPYRRIYQTRHTFACWQLTAHGNIAYIAAQMGHSDYSMLVKTYGRWMKTESHEESVRIWSALELKGHIAPTVPQEKSNTSTNLGITGVH